MGDASNKQIVISPDLHRRLKIHVATLGIPSIKGYVESLIEHAINTSSPPEIIGEPELVVPETVIVGADPEVVGEPELVTPSVSPMGPIIHQPDDTQQADTW